MKKIAVILPVYKKDRVDYLRKSVESIINQTYKYFHIFIGVDGPVNNDIADQLQLYEEKSEISIIKFKENRGLPCVLNDLLEICFQEGYEYIARMDADDISIVYRFEKQIRYMEAHPEVDIVGGAIEEIDENGNPNGKQIIYPLTHKDCRSFFSTRNPHAHPAVMIRKRFFEKAGRMYRPDYRQGQDLMMWYDGMIAGTIHANVEDVVLKFRVTNNLFSSRRNGLSLAKRRFKMRMEIKKGLHFGIKSTIYAYAEFIMLISPSWIKKIAYRVLR